MKKLCFSAFFIVNQLIIQAQSLKEKCMGTWVDNDSIHPKSMFFIGKNNEFIWTNINKTRVQMRYDTYIGNYELQKDTVIIVLSKKLNISLSSGFQHIENCEVNTQKWVLNLNDKSLFILDKFPDFNALFKSSDTFDYARKFYIPTSQKYEKISYDYLKTESCKLTYWEDLIDLVCK